MRFSYLLVACLLAACSMNRPSPSVAVGASERVSDQPLALLASELLGPPMLLEQRLSGRYAEKESSLRCVLQLSGGVLTVIGLTPFGSRAFVLTQTGTAYNLEKFIDRPLPFDPSHVLLDIQRVLFRRVLSHGQTAADGVHEISEGGERIRELWRGGMVVQRTFLEADGAIAATVSFSGPAEPVVAQRVELEAARGYTLVIETIAQRVLPE